MKITAITKLKQGDLWQALKRLGWSQAELSRRTGIPPSLIGLYLNLKLKPTEARNMEIQKAFLEAGEVIDIWEIWPEGFKGFNKTPTIEQTRDVPDNILIEMMGEQNPLITYEINEEKEILNKALKMLSFAEEEVIEECCLSGKTEHELAIEKKCTPQRINQIKNKALKKLNYNLRKTIIFAARGIA